MKPDSHRTIVLGWKKMTRSITPLFPDSHARPLTR